MAPETVEIKLDPSDTVTSVKLRLSDLRGKRVLLLLSPAGTLFKRRLDLILLQREAYRRAIQLALVSREADIIAYARELNISCFDSVEASEKSRWKRGRQKVFLPRHHQPSKPQPPDELRSIASRVLRRNRHPSRLRIYFERLFVLGLLSLATLAALYVVVPGATVAVSLRAEAIDAAVTIIADTKAAGVDPDKGIIPAQTLRATVETTATLPTTGLRNLDEVPARGTATFTNLTDRSLTVPANTILSAAAAPLLFRTVVDVFLPAGAGQTANAPFEAMQQYSGEEGNIAAGQINLVVGPLAESVTVTNPAPASGGALRAVNIVSAADKDSLLNIVRGQLQSLGYEDIQSTLTASQVIIIESIAIDEERKDWTNFSSDIGLMAEELTLNMRAVVSALVIDDRLGRQVSLAQLRDRAPPNMTLLPDTLQYVRGPLTQPTSGERVSFVAETSGALVAELDTARLLDRLAGVSIADALQILRSQPELAAPTASSIEIFPEGFNRMPLLSVRIDLQVRLPA
ncbi:MAG: baseplate J/gp47 family protein [Chloroflexota bacterium]|nr:baseplate J/gp47 family protein [Chloroflexota bacterium]